MMASQKFRPAALRRLFRTSTYLVYAFDPENPPSLAGRNFCLAMASQKVRPAALREFGILHIFSFEPPERSEFSPW